jgi:hypothetical protein
VRLGGEAKIGSCLIVARIYSELAQAKADHAGAEWVGATERLGQRLQRTGI